MLDSASFNEVVTLNMTTFSTKIADGPLDAVTITASDSIGGMGCQHWDWHYHM